jgi:GNAT superfamily N-acetyltransferase
MFFKIDAYESNRQGKMIHIEVITPEIAEEICRKVTADLPEYFGLAEVNAHYATGVCSRLNLAAKENEQFVGLLCIDFPYPKNANIYWMGILRRYHRVGIGKALLREAVTQAKNLGAQTISVETLAPAVADANYLKTYQFYQAMGFAPLFNLKPEGYQWDMVYMLKNLADVDRHTICDVIIRPLEKKDVKVIVSSFSQIGWNKPTSLFEAYLNEVALGERLAWVTYIHDQFAGYVTLKWHSHYASFKEQNIPEIVDLNVLPHFRNKGIGSLLLDSAEKAVANKCDMVGIGVGLYAGNDGGYGPAQRLYVKRGYIPDSKGVTYHYQSAVPGHEYRLDDDLVLWFTKKIVGI